MERDFATNTGIAVDINFNSHAHVERDQQGSCNHRLFVQISTHTLTWSVTTPYCFTSVQQKISTHTLTWSVTRTIDVNIYPQQYFNSHAHVERDTNEHRQTKRHQENFNSHAHVERDFAAVGQFDVVQNFNSHAHVERDSNLSRPP